MLLALNEFSIASGMGAEMPRTEQRTLLNTATRRITDAQVFFEARDMESDALAALGISGTRENILGRSEENVAAYETMRRRARRRGDRYFEVAAAQNLGYIARRRGDVVHAAALYESVLPLIDRDRNPDLYARLHASLAPRSARAANSTARWCCIPRRSNCFPHAVTTAGPRTSWWHSLPSSSAAATSSARFPRWRARCRCTKARTIRKASCPRCVWPATPRQDSDGTNSPSSICAWRNGATVTA